MKNNNTIFWIIGGIIIVLLVGPQLELFTIGGGSMTRSVPSTVSPGSSFTITYKISGVSGNYGVSIVDTVSGGCTPLGEHKFVIADNANYKTSESFTYTAPSSGSCTFSGDYKFGTEAIKNFADKTITISIDGNGDGDDNGDDNGDYNGNGNGDDNGGIPTFDLNQVLFYLGNFGVTILMLIILLGGIFILKLVFSK